jgi:hypothetical protein
MPPSFVGPVRIPQDYELLAPRPFPPKPPHKHMTKFLSMAMAVGIIFGVAATRYAVPIFFPAAKEVAAADAKSVKFSDTITGKGYFSDRGAVTVVLSDGRIVVPRKFRTDPAGWEAQITDDLWVKGGVQ